MAKNTISADEKRWRAEDDARALRRAQEIHSDPARIKEAEKVIKQELTALSSVASNISKKTSTTTAKKSTASKKKK